MKKQIFTLIMFLSMVTFGVAQKTITGMISSPDGEPLVGASVVVKGTNVGT